MEQVQEGDLQEGGISTIVCTESTIIIDKNVIIFIIMANFFVNRVELAKKSLTLSQPINVFSNNSRSHTLPNGPVSRLHESGILGAFKTQCSKRLIK